MFLTENQKWHDPEKAHRKWMVKWNVAISLVNACYYRTTTCFGMRLSWEKKKCFSSFIPHWEYFGPPLCLKRAMYRSKQEAVWLHEHSASMSLTASGLNCPPRLWRAHVTSFDGDKERATPPPSIWVKTLLMSTAQTCNKNKPWNGIKYKLYIDSFHPAIFSSNPL